jgi:hypothetical protein
MKRPSCEICPPGVEAGCGGVAALVGIGEVAAVTSALCVEVCGAWLALAVPDTEGGPGAAVQAAASSVPASSETDVSVTHRAREMTIETLPSIVYAKG